MATNQTLKTLTLPINEENITYEINKDSINGVIDIEHGGTGANSANIARKNLEVYSISEINNKIDEINGMDETVVQTIVNNELKLLTLTPGVIYPYAGQEETIPEGFLLCDGAEVSQNSYEELFNVIGHTYIPKETDASDLDENELFYLPNLKGKVLIGAGNGYALGTTGGEEKHTLTVEEMPRHSHSLWDDYGVLQFGATYGATIESSTADGKGYNVSANDGTDTNFKTSFVGGSGDTEGVGAPHNNMQPYTVVNYIISTGQTSISNMPIAHNPAISSNINYGTELPESGTEGELFYLLGNPDVEEETGIISITRPYIWNNGKWC